MSLRRREFLATTGAAIGLGTTGTAAAQDGATVQMITDGSTYYFDPIGLHVEPGTTVTFENASGSHNSVAYEGRIPDGASAWSTPVAQTGTHTFEEPGTYDYYCQPHKTLGMVGRIVVGEPGGPAAGSMPADGDVPTGETIVDQGQVSYEAFTTGGAGGAGGGGDTTGARMLGAGLLAGMGVLAAIVYWVGNSEGEPFRVGSAPWRRDRGLE